VCVGVVACARIGLRLRASSPCSARRRGFSSPSRGGARACCAGAESGKRVQRHACTPRNAYEGSPCVALSADQPRHLFNSARDERCCACRCKQPPRRERPPHTCRTQRKRAERSCCLRAAASQCEGGTTTTVRLQAHSGELCFPLLRGKTTHSSPPVVSRTRFRDAGAGDAPARSCVAECRPQAPPAPCHLRDATVRFGRY
jgi:hypothetical protein